MKQKPTDPSHSPGEAVIRSAFRRSLAVVAVLAIAVAAIYLWLQRPEPPESISEAEVQLNLIQSTVVEVDRREEARSPMAPMITRPPTTSSSPRPVP